MQKKRGRKKLTTKKIARTITMDADLPGAVTAKGFENLSGFLNDAGWEKLARAKKAPGHFRDTKGKSA